jgi:hypothetical protein
MTSRARKIGVLALTQRLFQRTISFPVASASVPLATQLEKATRMPKSFVRK